MPEPVAKIPKIDERTHRSQLYLSKNVSKYGKNCPGRSSRVVWCGTVVSPKYKNTVFSETFLIR